MTIETVFTPKTEAVHIRPAPAEVILEITVESDYPPAWESDIAYALETADARDVSIEPAPDNPLALYAVARVDTMDAAVRALVTMEGKCVPFRARLLEYVEGRNAPRESYALARYVGWGAFMEKRRTVFVAPPVPHEVKVAVDMAHEALTRLFKALCDAKDELCWLNYLSVSLNADGCFSLTTVEPGGESDTSTEMGAQELAAVAWAKCAGERY